MRRSFFFTVATFLILFASAQKTSNEALVLKELTDKGTVLNKGWTFHSGDDPRYAALNFEGGEGIPVDPTLWLGQLPAVKKAGVGWFRLKMQVDSSLKGKTVGVMLSLFGAAEIYLNGEQVYRFGRVSADYKSERTQAIYTRTLSLTLGQAEEQLLAVRFSHHPKNLALKSGIIPGSLRLSFLPLNLAIEHYAFLVKRVYRFLAISLTIELTAALLTLFFYFSFRSRKEYLYFGLYFTLNFLAMLVQSSIAGISESDYISVNQLTAVQLIVYLLLTIGTLFHLNAIYALLQIQRTKYYRFLFCYAIISLMLMPFLSGLGEILPFLFFPLTCLEILFQYYKAARRRFQGAWILFFSILACFLFLLMLVNANLESNAVLTALSLLTPALGVIIFLAGDFARTSSALQKQIVEVKALSEKNISYEREKQDILSAQKDELEKEVQNRTAALRQSLVDLKAAQAKLVQSEKMASLGELTAGVAHEIQNPLNFINNFSELSAELSKELKEELENVSLPAEQKNLLQGTADELGKNQEKILHHGRRADAIVKNMLQHSRKSEGLKEPTDINALADQYLQLSYHGLRARDKNFNTAIKTDYDHTITAVSVVPQEIGRVLLNLFNNAFYAVNEKKKKINSMYEPAVTVSTKKEDNRILITIRDNGIGIPSGVVEKIFQPFFTTKPTGEGTGLGLSLSYDIVTKGHGGELKVESAEGEGAFFMIRLPL